MGFRLYCGFEDAIEVFDLNNPGEGTRLATTPSRKSRDGLKGGCHSYLSPAVVLDQMCPDDAGIISALAFCPSYDPSSSMFAAGTLTPSSSVSPNIALFSEDTGGKPVGWIGDVKASVTQARPDFFSRFPLIIGYLLTFDRLTSSLSTR